MTKEIYSDLEKGFLSGRVDSYISPGPESNGTLSQVLNKYNKISNKNFKRDSPVNFVKRLFKTI